MKLRRFVPWFVLTAPALALTVLGFFAVTSAAQDPPAAKGDSSKSEKSKDKDDPETTKDGKVVKTDEQWAKILTPIQFAVTRRKATEPAFENAYHNNHARGEYDCICCKTPLFSSKTKFDSGTGWPSFYAPIDPKAIEQAADYELGYARVEVTCRKCGAHLGHVFDDGPDPTGLRFCMNSASLKFVPATGAAAKPAAKTAKAKTKTKGSAKAKTSDAEKEKDGSAADSKKAADGGA